MRIVILGSGRGSNAEAILNAQAAGRLPGGTVVQLFADRPDAGILALGPRFRVPAAFVDPAPFRTKLEGEGEARYIDAIAQCRPDLVVLAGFMRVLKQGFLQAFAGKIVNLHPSLLPSFPGLDAIGQAWRRGVKITGCTVHYVTPEVDGGPIIDQAVERVSHALSPDDYVAVGRDIESQVLARAVRWHCEHRIMLNGRRTIVFS